ncbi:MAG: DMT family transporter [Myxococcota bacterium]|nr:DMT family transporter [Myxococcota bacterium]
MGEFFSIASALCWAVALLLFRVAPAAPDQLNLFKNSLALLCLLFTLPWIEEARWLWSGDALLRLALSGAVGIGIADTLFLSALKRLGATGAAIVECTYPIFVITLSFFWLSEPLSLAFLGSAALIIFGVGLAAIGPQAEGAVEKKVRSGRLSDEHHALLLGVASMALMAFGVLIAKPVLDENELCSVTTARLFWGIVAQSAWLLLSGRRAAFSILRPSMRWRSLAAPAFLGTYVAMLLWLAGMKYATLSLSTALSQLAPIFTLFLARVFFKEPLGARRLLGASCATLGTIAALLTGSGN